MTTNNNNNTAPTPPASVDAALQALDAIKAAETQLKEEKARLQSWLIDQAGGQKGKYSSESGRSYTVVIPDRLDNTKLAAMYPHGQFPDLWKTEINPAAIKERRPKSEYVDAFTTAAPQIRVGK